MGYKLIGLMLSVIALGALFYLAYGRKTPADEAAAIANATATLGAPPPTNVGSNAKVARQFTERQACLATCAAEDSNCRAIAVEAPATEACGKAKAACDARCP